VLPDPARRFEEVALGQQVARPRPGPAFTWHEGAWRLSFPRPETDRLEYLIGVDGAFLPDPSNPLRAPGPFGDKSVIEWPEYEAPAWLSSIADAGPVERVELRCRRLVARVDVLVSLQPEVARDRVDAGVELDGQAVLLSRIQGLEALDIARDRREGLLSGLDVDQIRRQIADLINDLISVINPASRSEEMSDPKIGGEIDDDEREKRRSVSDFDFSSD